MTRTPRILLTLLVLQATLLAALWSRRTGEDVPPPPELFLLGTQYEAIAVGAGQSLDPADSAGVAWTLVMAFSASCQWWIRWRRHGRR